MICRVLLEAKASGVDIAPADVSVTCSVIGCPTGLGNHVTVSVVGHFQLLTPILAPFFGGSQDVTFTRSATNQIETLPAPDDRAADRHADARPPRRRRPTPTPPTGTGGGPTPTPGRDPDAEPDRPNCTLPSAGFT